MAKHGKRYSDVLKKAPTEPVSLEEAVAFVKANANANFDETVEVAMRLGVDFKVRPDRARHRHPAARHRQDDPSDRVRGRRACR